MTTCCERVIVTPHQGNDGDRTLYRPSREEAPRLKVLPGRGQIVTAPELPTEPFL